MLVLDCSVSKVDTRPLGLEPTVLIYISGLYEVVMLLSSHSTHAYDSVLLVTCRNINFFFLDKQLVETLFYVENIR